MTYWHVLGANIVSIVSKVLLHFWVKDSTGPANHCIIVTFNSAAGYDKNKKGIEHKDAKS